MKIIISITQIANYLCYKLVAKEKAFYFTKFFVY